MRREFTSIKQADNNFLISEFPLPAISEGDITYTDSDAICNYVLDKYFPIYQGAFISEGKLYQSFGGPKNLPSTEGTGYAVFDISDGILIEVVRVPFKDEH